MDDYVLPPDFTAQLERVLAPGEAPAAAVVITDALRLGDDALGAFLEAFAARVAASPEPVTAAELRSMVARAGASNRSASQRRSQ